MYLLSIVRAYLTSSLDAVLAMLGITPKAVKLQLASQVSARRRLALRSWRRVSKQELCCTGCLE